MLFPKTLSSESINRGVASAHTHTIAWTQKILAFMSSSDGCRQKKNQPPPPQKKNKKTNQTNKKTTNKQKNNYTHTHPACTMCWNVAYLYGWMEKTVTYTKISPKMVNPRDAAGHAEEEEGFTRKCRDRSPICRSQDRRFRGFAHYRRFPLLRVELQDSYFPALSADHVASIEAGARPLNLLVSE